MTTRERLERDAARLNLKLVPRTREDALPAWQRAVQATLRAAALMLTTGYYAEATRLCEVARGVCRAGDSAEHRQLERWSEACWEYASRWGP